jgi:hypothetical protein
VRLYLVNESKSKLYSLRQNRIYMHINEPWSVGDLVCAHGETSAVGTIINTVMVNDCLAPNLSFKRNA